MSDGIRFISAGVMHARLRPKRNAFRYAVPYVAIPSRAMEAPARHGLFSVDKANLFSVRLRDYGNGGVGGLAWVKDVLAQRNLSAACGEIVLVTIPRILGFAFNPISLWFCRDAGGALRAVVAEVNNTFGERHFYVCSHDDRRAIAPADRIRAEKVFHVSPFMRVEGHYVFSFSLDDRTFGARIDLHDGDGLILTTGMAGKPVALSSGRLALALLANPLLMVKVLGLIHYQAVRLWAKGVANFRKPPPPAEPVTD